MKLIIDIPEEAYNRLLQEQHLPNRLDIEYFIIHGIPLEDIKAEIDNIRDVEVTDGTVYVSEELVFKILDNHIESVAE